MSSCAIWCASEPPRTGAGSAAEKCLDAIGDEPDANGISAFDPHRFGKQPRGRLGGGHASTGGGESSSEPPFAGTDVEHVAARDHANELLGHIPGQMIETARRITNHLDVPSRPLVPVSHPDILIESPLLSPRRAT